MFFFLKKETKQNKTTTKKREKVLPDRSQTRDLRRGSAMTSLNFGFFIQ